jgi:hypothetical protein
VSTVDPLRGMARVARRIPGYPVARRILVPRLRASPVFRAIAHRLWVTNVTTDGRGADLTAGNLLAGVGLQTLPVVLIVLAEVPGNLLESVVDEIARIQLLTAGFRPVLLFGRPDFGAARKYGYPAELIPPLPDQLSERVQYWQRLRRTYGTALVCEIPADGLSQTQRAFLLSLTHES